MRSKGTIVTIGIVILLTIIYIIQQRSVTQKSATAGYIRLLPDDFDPSEAWEIEMYRGDRRDKGVKLKRDGDIWKVVNFSGRTANNSKITKLFSDLKSMEGELRASQPEVFPEFLISDEKAVHIVLYDKKGDELLHLLIGKREPIFGKRFVRFKDDNNVYLTDKKLSSSVGAFGDNNEKYPDYMGWLGQ